MSLMHVAKFWTAALIGGAVGCGTGGTTGTGGGTTGTGGGTTIGTGGAGGSSGGAGGVDAGKDSGSSCPGQCVPGPAAGWAFPNLVWFGADPKDAPPCWPEAPLLSYEGHEELNAPTDCGTCTCAPSTGTCALPTTMTANAAPCALNNGSTAHTSFNPSSGWNGACDASTSIPSGKLCSGVKCVQSLTIGALGINEAGCMPSVPPSQPTPTWKTFVRACGSVPHDPCESLGNICIPASPEGFHVCIYQKGDNPCPVEFTPYTEKHLMFTNYEDTRGCSPCACGAPNGSSCSSLISMYTDGACSTLAASATVTSATASCQDLPPGLALGSKSATAPTYTAGMCAPSGGEPMGAATPMQPATYCCLPQP